MPQTQSDDTREFLTVLALDVRDLIRERLGKDVKLVMLKVDVDSGTEVYPLGLDTHKIDLPARFDLPEMHMRIMDTKPSGLAESETVKPTTVTPDLGT